MASGSGTSNSASVSASASVAASSMPNISSEGSAKNTAANVVDLGNDVESEKEDDEPAAKRNKKRTSKVWLHFTEEEERVEKDGQKTTLIWAKCNRCKYKRRGESHHGTKVLWNHLQSIHQIVKGQQELKFGKKADGGVVIEPYRYDQEASLRKFYLAIIMHEYPFNIVEHEYFIDFIKSLRPNFPMKSRITVRKELMDFFIQEKEKLYEYFKTVKCRLSTTMDMWTSNQNKAYMCVTVHWIDEDWKIQKRIIKFMHVGGRHTGSNLCDAFITSVMRWFIEKKLFSLTLDNAAANDLCVKDVIVELKKICPLPCDGMFFHVRCANHILNLVARDGLQAIASAVQNIRSFVLAIKSSPLQWEEFMKCASECQLDSKKGVALDVTTRWNSTYFMLMDALYYKEAFKRLILLERQRYEKIAPSDEEWDKAFTLCKCLKKFNDITELLSGTLYPTANLFYQSFCDIKLLIAEWCASDDTTIKTMALSMSAKFNKYWKKSNTALAVASFLDPRFKKGIIEFYMMRFYGEFLYQHEVEEFMRVVRQLYNAYASAAPNVTKHATSAASSRGNFAPHGLIFEDNSSALENFLYHTNKRGGIDIAEANDLDKYMAEPPLNTNNKFDILSWWKIQQEQYPILSQLARDVLAMQVSTVASESAFSAGGRVIDPFRSRLEPEMVEALICTKDWMAASRRGSKNNVASIVADLEVLETLAANMGIQEEEEKASDD